MQRSYNIGGNKHILFKTVSIFPNSKFSWCFDLKRTNDMIPTQVQLFFRLRGLKMYKDKNAIYKEL